PDRRNDPGVGSAASSRTAAGDGVINALDAAPSSVAPGWLLRGEIALGPCRCGGRRRRGSVVAKTLTGMSELARAAVFSEDAAAAPGLLQRLDARVKVVCALMLL